MQGEVLTHPNNFMDISIKIESNTEVTFILYKHIV